MRAKLSLLLFLLTGSLQAQPESIPDLWTPRRTVESFLRHTGEGVDFDLEQAATCLDTSRLSRDPAVQLRRGAELSKRLSDALDELGLELATETLPDEPAPANSIYPLLTPDAHGLFIVKTSAGWKISASSLKAIDRLHRQAFGRFAPALIERLPTWSRRTFAGIAFWQLAGIALGILGGLALRSALIWLVGNRLRRHAESEQRPALAESLQAAARPLGLLAVSLTLRFVLPELQFGPAVLGAVRPLLTAIATLAAIWLAYRQIDALGRYLERLTSTTESRLDDQLVPLVRKVLKVLAIAVGFVFLLHNVGVQVTSLIAGLGIGGLAVALAAQETLSNFFASLVILADRPFQIGDLVSTTDVNGTVEQVGLRSTRIRTADRSLVTVPNSKLASGNIRNLGQRYERLMVTRLNVTYDTPLAKLDQFQREIEKLLDAKPRAKRDERIIRLDALGASGLELLIEVYLDVQSRGDELDLRQEILRELLTLATKLGVSFAYPTQTVQLKPPAGA